MKAGNVRATVFAMAAAALGVTIAACGGGSESKTPVNAKEVPAAGSASAKEGSCGAHKDGSCGAKKEGSCGAKKDGSCSAKKDGSSLEPAPATTASPAMATVPATTAAPATTATTAAAATTTVKPKAKPPAPNAGGGTSESGCGAGSCASKKK
jgi:hypothetical protein